MHRKIKATYMNPQEWKPQSGLPPISRGSNIYIIQAHKDSNRNNKQSGTGHRSITAQNNRIGETWDNIKLERLKSWHKVFQEDHIRSLWFDL